jgi:hypothetical protein
VGIAVSRKLLDGRMQRVHWRSIADGVSHDIAGTRSLLPTQLATLLFRFGEPFKMVNVMKPSLRVGQVNAAILKNGGGGRTWSSTSCAGSDPRTCSTTCVSNDGDAFLDLSAIDRTLPGAASAIGSRLSTS